MPSPRRLIPRLLLCLSLGVILTFATSWSLTLWSPYTSGSLPPQTGDDFPPDVAGPDGSQGWWAFNTGRGITCAVPLGARCSGEGTHFVCWRGEFTPAYRRAGWPALALGSTVNVALSPSYTPLARWQLPWPEILRRGLNTSDLPPRLHAEPDRRLALIPVWPGFAINTGLYAALAWTSITALAAARRTHRLRRGRCPACAYNLSGLPPNSPCPECGRLPP